MNEKKWFIQITKFGPSLYENREGEEKLFHGLVTKRSEFSSCLNVIQYVDNRSGYGQTWRLYDEVWESKTLACLKLVYMLDKDFRFLIQKKEGL